MKVEHKGQRQPLLVGGCNICNICRDHSCTDLSPFDHLYDYAASSLVAFCFEQKDGNRPEMTHYFCTEAGTQTGRYLDPHVQKLKFVSKFDKSLKVMQFPLSTVQRPTAHTVIPHSQTLKYFVEEWAIKWREICHWWLAPLTARPVPLWAQYNRTFMFLKSSH